MDAEKKAKLEFGARLRQAREDAKLSQGKLAKMLNVTQGAISSIELGRNKSTISVFALADAIGVEARWLETGTHRVGHNLNIDKPEPEQ